MQDIINKYCGKTESYSCTALGRKEIHSCVFDESKHNIKQCDTAVVLNKQNLNQITGNCKYWQKIIIENEKTISQEDAWKMLEYIKLTISVDKK